jgi:hypothetical protein
LSDNPGDRRKSVNPFLLVAVGIVILTVIVKWVISRFLGELLDPQVQLLRARWRSARLQRLQKRNDQSIHSQNVVSQFASEGVVERLYLLQSTAEPIRLPMILDTSARFEGVLEPNQESLIKLVDHTRIDLPSSKKEITRLTRVGVKAWDGSVICAGEDPGVSGPLRASVNNYWAVVTMARKFGRASDSPQDSSKFLVSRFQSFEGALGLGDLRPINLGADVTCVFVQCDGELVTGIHKRSSETINAHGVEAVTPSFTFESNQGPGGVSQFTITYYNFIKEFLEEFFGEPGLLYSNEAPLGDHPDWILRSANKPDSPCARILNEISAGRVVLSCTGAAMDLTFGGIIFALMAKFEDSNFFEYVRDFAEGSEEAAKRVRQSKIRYAALGGSELESLMTPELAKVSSIFSLDRARASLGIAAGGA